jgi:hypothetical protein
MRAAAPTDHPTAPRPAINGALALALVAATRTPAPTVAISAEGAKKCRAVAAQSHPPRPAASPYAQAERDAFRAYVAKEQTTVR